jgi:hypothetical protein
MYVEKDAFLEVKSLENTQPNLKICQIILTWETILREKKEWNEYFLMHLTLLNQSTRTCLRVP